MNIKKDIAEDRTVTLEIELPVEDVGQKFTDALKVFQQQANIPGFRPGRVPMNLIRKRWGMEIFSETAEALAKEKLGDALKQEELEPAGRIDLQMLDFGEDKPLSFKVTFPLQPEVKLAEYKGLKLTVNAAEIGDEEIEQQLLGLQKQRAVMTSIDTPATTESVVTVKVQEVDPSGLPLIGEETREEKVEFGMDVLGLGSDEQLLGIKSGETRVIQTRPKPDEQTGVTESSKIITPDQARQESSGSLDKHLRVEAIQVEIPELPAIDDDFAKSISEDLNTVDDLKDMIRQNLLRYVEAGNRRWREVAIKQKMIELNPFPIARSIIDTVVDDVADERKLEGEPRKQFLEIETPRAEHDLRWMMLVDEVGKTESIEVTEEEMEAEYNDLAQRTGYPVEKIKENFQGEEASNQLRRRIFEGKVIDFIGQNADIETRKMDLADFLRATPYIE